MTAPPSPLALALRGKCPHCGDGHLFAGPIGFAPKCTACGLDFAAFNVGDGPAAFLILIVGGLVTGLAIWLELAASPAWWAHLIWLPVTVGLTIGGLRLGKAALLAQEYRTEARDGRNRP
ncbi:MAG: DUF983 domain-containing protein [Sphingomicrobium sp.]